MKRTTRIFILLLVLLTAICCFVACNKTIKPCSHDWKQATCTKPKTCKLCQKTEGNPNGHNWTEANCTTPKMCSVCTLLEGSALGHDYVEESCKRCGVSSPTPQTPFSFKLSTDKSSYVLYARGNHSDPHLVIPSKYKGLPVMGIQQEAFKDCTYLTKITVPDSIQAFGPGTFENCTNLTTIVFESEYLFKSLGLNCFAGCTALEEIKLPNSLSAIGSGAFKNCTKLKNVVLPDSVNNIGEDIFAGCYNLEELSIPFIGPARSFDRDYPTKAYNFGYLFGTVAYQGSYLSSYGYYIPFKLNKLTVTGGNLYGTSFNNCYFLYQVTIGKNVKFDIDLSFEDAILISNIFEPSQAFDGCYKLMEVYDFSALNFTSDVIKKASNLTVNVYNTQQTANNFKTINGFLVYDQENSSECYVLEYKNDDKVINLPENILGKPYHLMPYAFYANENIDTLKFTSETKILSIGNNAFKNIKNIYIDKIETWINSNFSNTLFGYSTFSFGTSTYTEKNLYVNDTLLTKLIIPKEIVEIPEYTFNYITSITEISVEEGSLLTKIDRSAFANNPALTAVSLTNCKNLTIIESMAFYNCINLTDVILNSNLNLIECASDIFAKCDNIKGNEYKGGIYLKTDSNPYFALISIKDNTLTNFEIAQSTEYVIATEGDGFYKSAITNLFVPSSVKYFAAPNGYNNSSYWYNLEVLQIEDLSSWCNIVFSSPYANPLFYAQNIHINNQNVTDLVIPTGTEIINDYAFVNSHRNYYNIKSIRIPNTVKKIGKDAFLRRNGVDLYIEDLVSWLNIEFVNLDSNPMSNKSSTAETEKSTTLYITNQKVTSLKIPNGIKTISNYAFANLPDSVTEVSIPSSIMFIGKQAFANTKIILNIDDLASWCNVEIDLLVKQQDFGVSEIESVSVGTHPFIYATEVYFAGQKLTSLIIPEGVTEIKSYTFVNLEFDDIFIPASVKKIGNSAFVSFNSDINDLYIADLTSWLNIDFENYNSNPANNCKNVYLFDVAKNEYVIATEITIPKEITEIKPYAFYNWLQLNKVTFEKDSQLTKIGKYAFYSTSITEITIPKHVEYIGEKAFITPTITSVNFENTQDWYFEIIKSVSNGQQTTETVEADVTNPSENATNIKKSNIIWHRKTEGND